MAPQKDPYKKDVNLRFKNAEVRIAAAEKAAGLPAFVPATGKGLSHKDPYKRDVEQRFKNAEARAARVEQARNLPAIAAVSAKGTHKGDAYKNDVQVRFARLEARIARFTAAVAPSPASKGPEVNAAGQAVIDPHAPKRA
jgi:hypothetical protein